MIITKDPLQNRKTYESGLSPTRAGFAICYTASETDIVFTAEAATVNRKPTAIRLKKSKGRVLFWHWGHVLVAHEPRQGLHIIQYGAIWEPSITTPEELKRSIAKEWQAQSKESLARSLRGSFVLVIIESENDRITFITDRSGSQKIFHKPFRNQMWFSSSVECLPDLKPDPAGVASMIVNNFCFHGRTILADVSILERASLYEFHIGRLRSTRYWQPTFGEGGLNLEEFGLESLYTELIRQAVQRRVPKTGQIFISISGGMDSRVVFGLLVSDPNVKERITAFSYGEESDEDVRIAKEMCAFYEVPHKVACYQGNLAETIRRNGLLSQGLVSFYTHGLDGLFGLQDEFHQGSVIFVGDIAFREGTSSFESLDDMFTYGVGIRSPAKIPKWLGYGLARISDIEDQLNGDIEVLKKSVSHYLNLSDANQYLFLDQRQNYQILPWREFYTGRFLPVANPLIDEDILDFAAKVPSNLTYDKRLHKNTVKKMFPELFRFPVASSRICNKRAFRDFVLQKSFILQLVNDYESHLDEIVPPPVLNAALVEYLEAALLDSQRVPKLIRRIIDIARWKFRTRNLCSKLTSNRSRFNGDTLHGKGLPVLGPRQLGKLLSMRYFFRK